LWALCFLTSDAFDAAAGSHLGSNPRPSDETKITDLPALEPASMANKIQQLPNTFSKPDSVPTVLPDLSSEEVTKTVCYLETLLSKGCFGANVIASDSGPALSSVT
jgi:hypothetical protein